MVQLCLWIKIRTNQTLVLGVSAFQCMRAGFHCSAVMIWIRMKNTNKINKKEEKLDYDELELFSRKLFRNEKINFPIIA